MTSGPVQYSDELMPIKTSGAEVFMVSEPAALAACNPFEIIENVRAGFSPIFLQRLAEKLDISNEILASLLGTSAISLSRWATSGKRLGAQISETALKIQELHDLAASVLGSAPEAIRWFKSSNYGLAGQRPLDLLDTETGRAMVRRQLLAIEHTLGF